MIDQRRKRYLAYISRPSLVALSSLIHYWDARFSGQFYQEIGRTNLSGNGQAIGSWTDRKGSAHLGQSTAGNKPTNISDDRADFDGNDDFLTATIATIPANGFTIYYRIVPDTLASIQVHIDWGDMTISGQTNGTVQASQSSVGAVGSSTGVISVDTINTIGFRYNRTSGAWRWAINGSNPNTGTQIRGVTGTSLNIGAENGASFRFNGKFLSLAIYNDLHSNSFMDNNMKFWRDI